MFTNNVGGVDAAIRGALGSLFMVLAAVAADQRPVVALGLAVVAAVILVTAIAGVCPLYTFLSVDTTARARPHFGAKPHPVLR